MTLNDRNEYLYMHHHLAGVFITQKDLFHQTHKQDSDKPHDQIKFTLHSSFIVQPFFHIPS